MQTYKHAKQTRDPREKSPGGGKVISLANHTTHCMISTSHHNVACLSVTWCIVAALKIGVES